MIEHGNHTKDPEDKKILAKLVCGDVNFGYGLPLTMEAVPKIKFAEVYPMNAIHQEIVNELGEIIPRMRASHDLSCPKQTKRVLNQRCHMDQLAPYQYGSSLH